MMLMPTLLMVVLPLVIGFAAARASSQNNAALGFLNAVPNVLAAEILAHPPQEQLLCLVLGYLLAPLFMIVPLMVSAVIAADAFAGEKERRTMEMLLHLPITDRDLFLAKLLTSYIPALGVTWGALPPSPSLPTQFPGNTSTALLSPTSFGSSWSCGSRLLLPRLVSA